MSINTETEVQNQVGIVDFENKSEAVMAQYRTVSVLMTMLYM